jgi:hypothetical protein
VAPTTPKNVRGGFIAINKARRRGPGRSAGGCSACAARTGRASRSGDAEHLDLVLKNSRHAGD